ncbi:MAG: DNA-directed polymerase subunit beta [Paenibacillaceae bacterium]|jgi:hypothetical protein|nr:DNA-directed polymerase subunit beta [Paenibacillaceae bacterium]
MAKGTKAAKPDRPAKKKGSSRNGWSRYGWPVVRHMIVPVICLLVLIAGMTAGYVVLGGKPYSDVWQWDTWRHMFDLIFS